MYSAEKSSGTSVCSAMNDGGSTPASRSRRSSRPCSCRRHLLPILSGQESGFFEAATKLNRGALATSVWVVDQAGRWPASVDSLAFNASSTRSVLRLLAMDHPTTFP
jgi:hypothetical protein